MSISNLKITGTVGARALVLGRGPNESRRGIADNSGRGLSCNTYLPDTQREQPLNPRQIAFMKEKLCRLMAVIIEVNKGTELDAEIDAAKWSELSRTDRIRDMEQHVSKVIKHINCVSTYAYISSGCSLISVLVDSVVYKAFKREIYCYDFIDKIVNQQRDHIKRVIKENTKELKIEYSPTVDVTSSSATKILINNVGVTLVGYVLRYLGAKQALIIMIEKTASSLIPKTITNTSECVDDMIQSPPTASKLVPELLSGIGSIVSNLTGRGASKPQPTAAEEVEESEEVPAAASKPTLASEAKRFDYRAASKPQIGQTVNVSYD